MDAGAEVAQSEGKASLQKAITWCTTDAAGPGLGLLRTALLDLTSMLLAQKAVAGAHACLQAAATAGACLKALLSAPQDLGTVAAAAVPAWASTILQGQLLSYCSTPCSRPCHQSRCYYNCFSLTGTAVWASAL